MRVHKNKIILSRRETQSWISEHKDAEFSIFVTEMLKNIRGLHPSGNVYLLPWDFKNEKDYLLKIKSNESLWNDYRQGAYDAIKVMCPEKRCDECGGQAHGKVSYDAGFSAAITTARKNMKKLGLTSKQLRELFDL